MAFLGVSFFVTALIYATIGFGGGSTYTALLALGETDNRLLPVLSLMCNIIVVTGGALHFSKVRPDCLKKALPWVGVSVPAAWVGGQISLGKEAFLLLLAASLLAASLHLLVSGIVQKQSPGKGPEKIEGEKNALSWQIVLPAGSGIGFLSGIVGIGGGIFLSPLLYLLKREQEKTIAGICSIFILLNSISGLTGHLMKEGGNKVAEQAATEYFPLFLCVFLGGQVGSLSGSRFLDPRWIRVATALLILYVSLQLFARWWDLAGK